ncbi:hypothetical protein TPDSL_13930 [Terrisporobacter petrolearius]|uniref:hypothetical protein n=1 Tax=Terrisporobacter petrolearius TaxID=1460447 RepID=UPI00336650B4
MNDLDYVIANIKKKFESIFKQFIERAKCILKDVEDINILKSNIQKKIDIHKSNYKLFRFRYIRSLACKHQVYNNKPKVVCCRRNL